MIANKNCCSNQFDLNFPKVERKIYNMISENGDALNSLKCRILAHFTQSILMSDVFPYLPTILNKANEMNEILREVKVSLDGKKKYEDSGVNTDDIVKKALSLREVTNQIMNKPKPAPKVEEKKDEEKKTEDKSEDKPAGEEKKSATTEGGEQKMDIDP